jgi:uncharacterized membrane protein
VRKTIVPPPGLHFFPLAHPFVLAFFLLVALLIGLIEIGILGYAYEKMGVNQRYVFLILALSLFGSYVNIPVAELPAERVITGREVLHFGMRYVIPRVEEWPRTIVAVNLGGAIIPTVLSLYLLLKNRQFGRSAVGVAVVTAIVYWLAQPVEGMGIAVPVFIPPAVAAVTAVVLSRQSAPPPRLHLRKLGDVDRS